MKIGPKWWTVNVHGVFYCTRAALKHMEPQQYGRIINIASIAGISTGSAHSPGYSATKAAVVNMTKTAAFDVARRQYLRERHRLWRARHASVRGVSRKGYRRAESATCIS